jgi:DNA transposition AAA+ family ATPase
MTESNQEPAADPSDRQETNTGNNARASWQFSLSDVRANMAHCDPESKAVMIEAFMYCIDARNSIHRADFARAIGYEPNTVYKVFTGKYTDPGTKARLDIPAKMISATREFLRLEKERSEGGKNEFVLTPTAKKIWTTFDLARESQSPVFVTGPSHIGKTWAALAYVPRNNHGRTLYVRMKAACGLGGMVRRINEVVGNSGNCNTAAAIDRVKRALTPNMLLILDETHLLQYTYRKESFFACLEVIREIYDEVGCGMALLGTRLLLDRMNEGRNGEMQQLLRRGVHRLVLPNMPTKADLKSIFEHHKIAFPERDEVVTVKCGKTPFTDKPYALVCQLAKAEGLKAIVERLRYGRKIAAREGGKLSWAHFLESHLLIEKQTQPEPDWE